MEKEENDLNIPQESNEEKGIIGEYYEGNFPVIVKFVAELPEHPVRGKYPVLIAVSWEYDGGKNNGMPPKETNRRMILLEDAIEKIMDSSMQFVHAYSRTGNSLKELVYYASCMDSFMRLLNEALIRHKRYPININSYEDPEWNELKKLIEDFQQ